MIFKNNFVKELKKLIPENIKKFDLVFPKEQNGYARFNRDRLDSVYLESLKDKHGNNIILKFKHRDFHYIPKDYKFSDIYVCSDGCNEYRYDKDLNLNAYYLKGVSIPSDLDMDMKLHLLDTIIEWRNMSKILGEHNYISEYQVKKDNKLVRNAYAVFSDKLQSHRKYSIMNDITNNFDLKTIKYFQKIEINNKKVTKKEDEYLIIQNKYE